jgi:hypothetical protein
MPCGFGLFMLILIVGGGIAAIMFGAVVYFLEKEKPFGYVGAILAAVIVFFLIVCGIPLLLVWVGEVVAGVL